MASPCHTEAYVDRLDENLPKRSLSSFFFFKYLFIWLCGVLVNGMQTPSCGMHVGSSSLTRDRTRGPLHWECEVLSTTPPGKSFFFSSKPFSKVVAPTAIPLSSVISGVATSTLA